MKSSFLIVADRGNLKAFRVEKTANDRPPRLRLVEAFSFADAHRKIRDQNTDMAGGFPVGGGNGQHQNSISDRHYEIEATRRSCAQLAAHMNTIFSRENPVRWSFAAPAEINETILQAIEQPFRQRVAENHAVDIVNASATELLERFSVCAVEAA